MGWVTEKGYKRLRVYDHPYRAPGSQVYEHVLIMEQQLGRKLRPTECVHHCDHRKKNNHPSNLELGRWPEHNRTHASKQPRDSRGRFVPKGKRGKR